MDKLVQDMKDAKKDFQKVGDKQNVERLDSAIKNAEQPKAEQPPMPMPDEKKLPINAQMKEVAKDLKDQNRVPPNSLDKQKEIVENLDNVLKSLEGKTEDLTRSQMEDHKKAEQKVDELASKLDKLRKDTQKVKIIEEKEERLKPRKSWPNSTMHCKTKWENTPPSWPGSMSNAPPTTWRKPPTRLTRPDRKSNKGATPERSRKNRPRTI